MARRMPLTTTIGSTPRCGMSGSMPDNLPACFFTPRVTFRVTLRAVFRAVAAVPGFARFARDFAAGDLPRDLAAADLARADLARTWRRGFGRSGSSRAARLRSPWRDVSLPLT